MITRLNTVNELYDYRITLVAKAVLREFDYQPKSPDDLFEFLYKRVPDFLGKALLDDMNEWDTEESWFTMITGVKP